MRTVVLVLTLVAMLAVATPCSDEFLTSFANNYDALQRQVLDRDGELAEIDSFTYTKDVATFHFGPGQLLLQRPVNGRPTVAIFVGQGHARIEIPVAAEREAFRMVAHDSLVDDSFMVCFMRIGDDFDRLVKERFTFEPGPMSVADFARVRNDQGEYYFKPTLFHLYDNLLQLLISTYERRADGYFWASFKHTTFCFDPNRSEQVHIGHARKPDITLDPAAPRFQRKEANRRENRLLSDLEYPTSMQSLHATLEMGGSDGWTILNAEIKTVLTVNSDSMRFVALFLDPHFEPDSIHCGDSRLDFYRRKDFYHLALFLPAYARRGDSLDITIWFHDAGRDYSQLLPWVENTAILPRSLTINYPKSYNYVVTLGHPSVRLDDKRNQCTGGPYAGNSIWLQPLPVNYDTIRTDVDSQIFVTYIAAKDHWSKVGKEYRDEVISAARFYISQFGLPRTLHDWYLFPEGTGLAPGMMRFPLTKGEQTMGGIHDIIGRRIAYLWCGPSVQIASYRERWLLQAVREYLNLMYIQKMAGSGVMYSNLLTREQYLEHLLETNEDIPLAVAGRADDAIGLNKGIWLLHMLRVAMYDAEKLNDDRFMVFIRELVQQLQLRPFTNSDFRALAEKHYGSRLDWFFNPWMYGRNFPDFDGSYTIETVDSLYYIKLNLKTGRVPANISYPVLLRVQFPDGALFLRQPVAGMIEEYQIGPFSQKPVGMIFNEYNGILCKSRVQKL
jgi:hypothetical protein